MCRPLIDVIIGYKKLYNWGRCHKTIQLATGFTLTATFAWGRCSSASSVKPIYQTFPVHDQLNTPPALTMYIAFIPWHEHTREQFNIHVAIINRMLLQLLCMATSSQRMQVSYILLLQLSVSSTASAYSRNIDKHDKQLATTYENFYYEIFVYQKILAFTKFLGYKNLPLYCSIFKTNCTQAFSLHVPGFLTLLLSVTSLWMYICVFVSPQAIITSSMI